MSNQTIDCEQQYFTDLDDYINIKFKINTVLEKISGKDYRPH